MRLILAILFLGPATFNIIFALETGSWFWPHLNLAGEWWASFARLGIIVMHLILCIIGLLLLEDLEEFMTTEELLKECEEIAELDKLVVVDEGGMRSRDLRFIAAAPRMAQLIAKLADKIRELEKPCKEQGWQDMHLKCKKCGVRSSYATNCPNPEVKFNCSTCNSNDYIKLSIVE